MRALQLAGTSICDFQPSGIWSISLSLSLSQSLTLIPIVQATFSLVFCYGRLSKLTHHAHSCCMMDKGGIPQGTLLALPKSRFMWLSSNGLVVWMTRTSRVNEKEFRVFGSHNTIFRLKIYLVKKQRRPILWSDFTTFNPHTMPHLLIKAVDVRY
jgi:hypothetical protein